MTLWVVGCWWQFNNAVAVAYLPFISLIVQILHVYITMDQDEQFFLDLLRLSHVRCCWVWCRRWTFCTITKSVCGWHESFIQCIFCYGSYTAKQRKGQALLTATAQGLRTIKASCSRKGDLALLTCDINENQFSNSLKFHQACRTVYFFFVFSE